MTVLWAVPECEGIVESRRQGSSAVFRGHFSKFFVAPRASRRTERTAAKATDCHNGQGPWHAAGNHSASSNWSQVLKLSASVLGSCYLRAAADRNFKSFHQLFPIAVEALSISPELLKTRLPPQDSVQHLSRLITLEFYLHQEYLRIVPPALTNI